MICSTWSLRVSVFGQTAKRSVRLAAGFAALLSLGPFGSALSLAQSSVGRESIADFMVMEVCVDAQDHVISGLTPVSPACTTRRKIRPTDPVPYHLAGFDHPSNACPGHITVHDNLPVVHDGVTRIVKTVRVGYQLCGMRETVEPAYYSVRWFDAKFGFIMGAWGRGEDGGKVGGGITPSCSAGPETSARYYRNWVFGTNPPQRPGEIGSDVFTKASAIQGLPALTSPCPTDYQARFLSIWSRGPFTYRSGVTLDTIISHPYSQADASGTTPGAGKQMERTYWTKEFGQVRWENWKRDDYVNNKTGDTAVALARKAFSNGFCSKPFELGAAPTTGISLMPIAADGAYSQMLIDKVSGEQHRWYMAGCLDLTNIVLARKPGGDPYPTMEGLPAKFWEFWIPPSRTSKAD